MGLSPSSYRINSTRQLSARGRNLEVSYSFSQTLLGPLQCTNGPPPCLPPPLHPTPHPTPTPPPDARSDASSLPVACLCACVTCVAFAAG